MKLNQEGYAALHQREGLRLKPYLDTKKVPTIAMGNTFYENGSPVKMTDKAFTFAEAEHLAKVVSDRFAARVNFLVKSEVNQNQFNALVSLAYNIGLGGFEDSTVLRLVNENPNNEKIGEAFMMWTKNKELIGRRKSEVEQYFK